MKNWTERGLDKLSLNVANPVEHAAEEYWCAMKILDERNIPRFYEDEELSLVGRIDFAMGCFHNTEEDQLNVAASGQKEDVCKKCAEMEEAVTNSPTR